MSRGAGRVFVKAPLSYLSASPTNTQETWDSLTANGQKELQRTYVIADKVSCDTSRDKRGRKSSPPKLWLDEDNNTKEVWGYVGSSNAKDDPIKVPTRKISENYG